MMATKRNIASSNGDREHRDIRSKKGPWRSRFLDHLSETSNVSASAEAAEKTTSEVYRERRKDPEFASQWLAALWEGYVHLEMEVLRRLRIGEIKTEGGDKFDFANAIRLLSAHRDNAARAHAQQRNVDAAEVRASIDRKVEAIRQQVQAERRQGTIAETRQ